MARIILVSYELAAYLPVFDIFLTQLIVTILSKGCKTDTFESHNLLKLSFTNTLGIRLNQTLLTFWLYVRQTWITQLNLSGNFSVRGYLPLI